MNTKKLLEQCLMRAIAPLAYAALTFVLFVLSSIQEAGTPLSGWLFGLVIASLVLTVVMQVRLLYFVWKRIEELPREMEEYTMEN